MTTAVHSTRAPASRLRSIDALRGLIILFMLLDHVRETFFMHHQVIDPMDVATTAPELFSVGRWRICVRLCSSC